MAHFVDMVKRIGQIKYEKERLVSHFPLFHCLFMPILMAV